VVLSLSRSEAKECPASLRGCRAMLFFFVSSRELERALIFPVQAWRAILVLSTTASNQEYLLIPPPAIRGKGELCQAFEVINGLSEDDKREKWKAKERGGGWNYTNTIWKSEIWRTGAVFFFFFFLAFTILRIFAFIRLITTCSPEPTLPLSNALLTTRIPSPFLPHPPYSPSHIRSNSQYIPR
jgi:hypothetical protein